jgi:hypothetical protein
VSLHYWGPVQFTRDGRGLVILDCDKDNPGLKLMLYDLAEGRFVRELAIGKAWSFGLSPDHKTLTTGLPNGNLMIWDAAPLLKPLPRNEVNLSEKEMLALWEDLAGDDGQQALQTRWKLACAKGVAVFLKGRISAEKGPAAKEVAAAIAGLDADEFTARERASRQLEQWGEVVEADLKRALDAKPSVEVSRRLEALLMRLAERRGWSEPVRALRGVAVLEAAGDSETPALLRVLADGKEGEPLAAVARAALKRRGDG